MIVFLVCIFVYLVIGYPLTLFFIWFDKTIEGPGVTNGEAVFIHVVWPVGLFITITMTCILVYIKLFPEGTFNRFLSRVYGTGK